MTDEEKRLKRQQSINEVQSGEIPTARIEETSTHDLAARLKQLDALLPDLIVDQNLNAKNWSPDVANAGRQMELIKRELARRELEATRKTQDEQFKKAQRIQKFILVLSVFTLIFTIGALFGKGCQYPLPHH